MTHDPSGSGDPDHTGGSAFSRTTRPTRARGVAYALLSAVLFGGSTPFVRPVLERVDPVASAGYLYLGQALVLSLWWIAARAVGSRREARLGRGDLAPLVAGIVAGGLIAPGAFTAGLSLLPAHRASLLLGLEIVFTLMIAILFRGERLAPRGWAGALLLLLAGVAVSWPAAASGTGVVPALPIAGTLLVVLACLGWATDSNVTASISSKDPTAISLLKGWAAAFAYLSGCALVGRPLGATASDALSLLVAGAVGYGIALRFFVLALRYLGAALTTTLFSTAPIAGFALSVILLGERPAATGWAAFALAGLGVAIAASGRHEHEHAHGPGTHEHPHVHDEHHDHAHEQGLSAEEGHTHVHDHGRLVHTHPHEADVHHTHGHGR